MNNLHRELAPFPIRHGLRSKRKHRARSSATSPDGALWTYMGRAASASPPSAPATCRRSAGDVHFPAPHERGRRRAGSAREGTHYLTPRLRFFSRRTMGRFGRRVSSRTGSVWSVRPGFRSAERDVVSQANSPACRIHRSRLQRLATRRSDGGILRAYEC
jgi:hypothetical protein